MQRPLTALLAGWAILAISRPSGPVPPDDRASIRFHAGTGRPKIAYSFNPDDDLSAIRRAGFTHILVSYLQAAPDAEQRRKLDECQRHGLKLIYRLVDLVDRARRSGSDDLLQHTVLLLRGHPALAGWQTYEETNLPAATQISLYRKIKSWDPHHPIVIVTTNEYRPGWYQRTYSDDAQDVLLIDFYPYKRRYDGWPYIHQAMVALRAAQKRPVPIIPVIQASSSTQVASAEDTLWPPSGGLEKQTNLWWSLGADAGVAFWLWRGSKEYPFVGIADRDAPAWAMPGTTALLSRIPDGELVGSPAKEISIPAVRIGPPRVNLLKNSGFEAGLEGWIGYDSIAGLTDQAYTGHRAVRMANFGAPKAIGIGQRADVLVPPNASVTFSAYYRVLHETALLQWMIDTTAYPRFGAAAFLEGKERLPAGDWRRASNSITNATGAPQRLKSVSILSTGFTGEVLLDNFQLELAPAATAYIERGQPQASSRHVGLPQRGGQSAGLTAAREWTVSSWCAPDVPPEAGDYACLGSIERLPARGGSAARHTRLELRLRVDARRSEPNGWIGALELAAGHSILCRMPVALAPGQPLFWSLITDRQGKLTVRAACAGYRLASMSARSGTPSSGIRAVSIGADAAGGHPLDGRASRARLTPAALPLSAVEALRASGEPQL